MAPRRIVAIWWRVLQRGEFFNIERRTNLVPGGGGARYIEVPSSLVAATLDFFEYESPEVGDSGFTIHAQAIRRSGGGLAPINFQVKTGNRLRITNQNRQADPNRRHPAWRSDAGFPAAPNDVADRHEASEFLPPGGVRIFIAKANDGSYLAGFTSGPRPDTIPADSPLQPLWINSGVGGVLNDLDLPISLGANRR